MRLLVFGVSGFAFLFVRSRSLGCAPEPLNERDSKAGSFFHRKRRAGV
jgi:hypothetical protein